MGMEQEIRDAVDGIVLAFGEGRMDDYFARFDPSATFVFYTAPERLGSVDAYRALWDRWVEEDELRILSCRTTDTLVQQLSADVAVVTHSVETASSTNAGHGTVHERETIVLRRQPDGSWLAVHEHLSPMDGS
jgi:ketosteroid isomerase-like protein